MTSGKFTLKESGLYVGASDESPGTRVASRIEVIALVRDGDSASWGKLLAWDDADGVRHEWAMPMSALLRGGLEALGLLANQGLVIEIGRYLVEYLHEGTSDKRVRRVFRTGWHQEEGNWCFVFPDTTVGMTQGTVTYAEASSEGDYGAGGRLEDWQREVSARCAGNSRLVLAVSAAFAAMVLRVSGHENGGVHLVGPSSSGKTTAAKAAASVFGGEKYVQRWRTTDNGLEGLAERHNDTLLVLDELGQADPRRLGDIAYMLANGQGKVRAARTGDAKPRKAWRLLFLSTGEASLSQHMASSGGRAKAGQEVRFVDLPAEGGKGLGLFEDLHGAAGPAEFSRSLGTAASQFYGTPARAFATECAQHYQGLGEVFAQEFAKVEAQLHEVLYASGKPGGQSLRVASRFAVIAAAGELATAFGITGWEEGEATAGAAKCFADWLDARGTTANSEPQAIIEAVQGFLGRHGESRFADLDALAEHDSRRGHRATFNRAGWRTALGKPTYYVLPAVFRSEICAGFEPAQVCRVLSELGCLESRVEDGKRRFTLHRAIPEEGKLRVYVLTDAIWEA